MREVGGARGRKGEREKGKEGGMERGRKGKRGKDEMKDLKERKEKEKGKRKKEKGKGIGKDYPILSLLRCTPLTCFGLSGLLRS